MSASTSEIEAWELFCPDIYRYVAEGKIWISPDTGQPLERCPWLRQLPDGQGYSCDIYHDRPDDCKHYPVSIDDMIKDECEMLEVQDRANPRQAQRTLNKLMAESRPPL